MLQFTQVGNARNMRFFRVFLNMLALGLVACMTAACQITSFVVQSSGLNNELHTVTITPSGTITLTLTATYTPFQPLPTSTKTLIPSLTPTATQTATPTHVPTATPTHKPTLPAGHFIMNITGHEQYFSIDCETAAAVDWARYFGTDISEYEFQYHLPISDNPDYGFVGSVNGAWGQIPPYAYGVYAGPVAKLLNDYGLPAKAYKGYTLDQLKRKITQNVPVMVWVIGNVEDGVPVSYTDSSGRTVVVAAFEHVVIVTGYDADHIRYMNEGMFYDTPTSVFLNSWGVLGNMVVVNK